MTAVDVLLLAALQCRLYLPWAAHHIVVPLCFLRSAAREAMWEGSGTARTGADMSLVVAAIVTHQTRRYLLSHNCTSSDCNGQCVLFLLSFNCLKQGGVRKKRKESEEIGQKDVRRLQRTASTTWIL